LGMEGIPGAGPHSSLGYFLQGKRMLLVLDNFEQVVDERIDQLGQGADALFQLAFDLLPDHRFGFGEIEEQEAHFRGSIPVLRKRSKVALGCRSLGIRQVRNRRTDRGLLITNKIG